MKNELKIREATANDFNELYKLGENTPEFKVSTDGEFMELDEFISAIKNKLSIFLIAEKSNQIIGFIYANRKDTDRPLKINWACLVYLVIKPEFRKQGIARALYDECVKRLKQSGITNIYGWANDESDGSILKFMKKQGFNIGHRYVWVDKKV